MIYEIVGCVHNLCSDSVKCELFVECFFLFVLVIYAAAVSLDSFVY